MTWRPRHSSLLLAHPASSVHSSTRSSQFPWLVKQSRIIRFYYFFLLIILTDRYLASNRFISVSVALSAASGYVARCFAIRTKSAFREALLWGLVIESLASCLGGISDYFTIERANCPVSLPSAPLRPCLTYDCCYCRICVTSRHDPSYNY